MGNYFFRELRDVTSPDDVRTVASHDDGRNVTSPDDGRAETSSDDVRSMTSFGDGRIMTTDDMRTTTSPDDVRNMTSHDAVRTTTSPDDVRTVASPDDRSTVTSPDRRTLRSPDDLTRSTNRRHRAERFVTLQQEDVETLRPFYDGDYVNQRMTEIRKSINYVRENWGMYDSFLRSLKKLIKEISSDGNSRDLVERARSLFSSRKDWKESADDVGRDPFDAIRVYTSEAGYSSFFAVIYSIFRKDGSTGSDETIRSAVFLVELLNIDLYNYCLKNPVLGNFQGTVYRGLSVSQNDLQKFQELFMRPIAQRYISVPLGLMSSSLDRAKADEFLSLSLATSDPSEDFSPLLMVIHVIELKPEYFRFYRSRFPDSVVTGICAVSIEDLSYHRNEREVILRGPFFQVLGLAEGEEIAGRRSHVLEMVMLNSNRDHVTSVQLRERDGEARQMFGTMVAVTRCEFCVRYCRDKGLVDDEREYQAMLDDKLAQLNEMMEH